MIPETTSGPFREGGRGGGGGGGAYSSIDFVRNGMSVPSEMPFSVEFSDEDVSSLQLVVLGRDLDGPIRHLVTDLMRE